ncbi:MAG TPA: kelch repeat-containing protein [Anaerolineales bacterium]|nr:kelch repeat-containing protein [Anaerolineales bacterium]
MNRSLLSLLVLFFFTSSCGPKSQPSPGDTWTQLKSMPTARSENAAAAVGDIIYVSGGFGGEQKLEAYDTTENTWRTLADLPEPRHHLMSASHNGKVYIFGGAASIVNWAPRADAWVYEPETDSWSRVALMPERRLAGAAVTLGDYIYVLGGTGGSNALLRYDPAQDEWTKLAQLSQSREHTTATTFDGRLYTLGGRWSGIGELTSVEIYDPASDSWTSAQTARAGFATVTVNGKIYVMGGEVLTGANQALKSVEVFDLASGRWEFAPDLPLALHGVPAVNVDDVIYVLGGADRAGAISNQGLVFSFTP